MAVATATTTAVAWATSDALPRPSAAACDTLQSRTGNRPAFLWFPVRRTAGLNRLDWARQMGTEAGEPRGGGGDGGWVARRSGGGSRRARGDGRQKHEASLQDAMRGGGLTRHSVPGYYKASRQDAMRGVPSNPALGVGLLQCVRSGRDGRGWPNPALGAGLL